MHSVFAAVAMLAVGCSFNTGGTSGDPGDQPDAASSAATDAATAPVYLFSDGFESGILPAWTGEVNEAGDTNNPSQDLSLTGSYSLRSTTDTTGNGQASTYIDFSAQSELFTRQHVFFPAGFDNADYVTLLSYVNNDDGWDNLFHVTLDANGEFYSQNQADGSFDFSGVFANTEQWYEIDTHVVIGTSGSFSVSIDGVEVISQSDIDTGDTDVTRIIVGIVWQGDGSESLRLFTDDVIVHDGPI